MSVNKKKVLEVFRKRKNDPAFAESSRVVASGGLPVEMVQSMSLRPEVLDLLAAFGRGVYPGGLLPRRLKELVILQSSILNSCQFCTGSHVTMIRQLGISGEPEKLLRSPRLLSVRERLALSYTKQAIRDSNRVSDALFRRMKKIFTDAEIVELTAIIGMIAMLNLFNNCLQNHYRGEYEKKRLP